MKKSLIALAVLATTSAAMAQSSVTLFGRLDAGLANVKTETTGAASVSQTKIDSSIMRTTYWGMKGSEDLGGGLKANFDLQAGFAIDTGVGNAGLFERHANVGLSGGFGAVNLGRVYTSYYSLFSATNNITDGNVATTGKVWATGAAATTVRASNAVRFDTADFGGFSGSVTYALNEAAPPASNENGTNLSLHVKYAAGPILVGVAYEEVKAAYLTPAAAPAATKNTLIAGSYDLGVAKLTGGYNMASDATRDDKEYQLGVNVPVGAAAVVMLGYTRSKSTGTGLAELTGKGYTIAGSYNLSKRTSLYAAFVNTEVETGTTTVSNAETRTFGAGVVHLF